MKKGGKTIGYWSYRVAAEYRNLIEERTRSLGLGASDAFLLGAMHGMGPSSLVELAQEMDTPHPTIVRQIDVLEQAGYAQRTPHPEDRRIKMVALTRQGMEVVPLLIEMFHEVHDIATRGVPKEQVEELIVTLKQLHRNMCDRESCARKSGQENPEIPEDASTDE